MAQVQFPVGQGTDVRGRADPCSVALIGVRDQLTSNQTFRGFTLLTLMGTSCQETIQGPMYPKPNMLFWGEKKRKNSEGPRKKLLNVYLAFR